MNSNNIKELINDLELINNKKEELMEIFEAWELDSENELFSPKVQSEKEDEISSMEICFLEKLVKNLSSKEVEFIEKAIKIKRVE